MHWLIKAVLFCAANAATSLRILVTITMEGIPTMTAIMTVSLMEKCSRDDQNTDGDDGSAGEQSDSGKSGDSHYNGRTYGSDDAFMFPDGEMPYSEWNEHRNQEERTTDEVEEYLDECFTCKPSKLMNPRRQRNGEDDVD